MINVDLMFKLIGFVQRSAASWRLCCTCQMNRVNSPGDSSLLWRQHHKQCCDFIITNTITWRRAWYDVDGRSSSQIPEPSSFILWAAHKHTRAPRMQRIHMTCTAQWAQSSISVDEQTLSNFSKSCISSSRHNLLWQQDDSAWQKKRQFHQISTQIATI